MGVRCSVDKWLKAKWIIEEMLSEVQTGKSLQHKELEQQRGFFVHLQHTYHCLTPFLKGFHLTLDGW